MYFRIKQLPDLKSQKYTNRYGQGVRQRVLANQKKFLLLLSELGKLYHLTISLRYHYNPLLSADRQLQIYFVVENSNNNLSEEQIEQIFEHSFLNEFYPVKRINPIGRNLGWVTYIAEAIKYEEIISPNSNDLAEKLTGLPYYVPLPIEADESNDMLAVCQAMVSTKRQLILEITLEPDITSLEEKSGWINALNQMLSQLKEASSSVRLSSSPSSSREGDRNAQLVSRIYEKYQSSYLTESLYRYSFKVLGSDKLAVRSVLSTLMLGGTKNSRYRSIVLTKNHPKFALSLSATQLGQLSTATYWEEWDGRLGEEQFSSFVDLKPLHRYTTLNEIIGLFRLVVPSDVPVVGIAQENDLVSLGADTRSLDFCGHELARPDRSIQIDLKQLNKHAFICGVPGSGKTTTAFNLLTELWCEDIPFLVFEPAKTEYRSLLAIKPDRSRFSDERLDKLKRLTIELRVYTLGNDLISPFRFNPFEVSAGVPFYEHISNLEACFRGAISLSGPLPALLSEALEEIYYDRDWTGEEEGTPDRRSIPTMRDLYEKISALFESKDYVGEVKSNLKTALEVRIGSLLRRGVGAMFDTERSSPTIAELLKHPTILELDYLNQDQANLVAFFLLAKIREYVKRKRLEGNGIPEHVILLEEAHNLVGRNVGVGSPDDANTKLEAANYLTRMLAEMRALREAIIIADQLPTAVAAEVVKNTNIKIAHRLVSADDRKDIGQAMLLDGSQMEAIARLNPGESFLYMEGWYRPRMVKIPYENSAKIKLGAEDSIASDKVKAEIQARSWYLQAQAILLDTAIGRYSRLAKEYMDSLGKIRKSLERVDGECDKLRESLGELGRDIFYRLASELKIAAAPPPIEPPIDSRSAHRLKNLVLDERSSLRSLLELRSELMAKLESFDLQYQKLVDLDCQIPRSKYEQKWQKLDRQMQTIDRQVANLSQPLGRMECIEKMNQQRGEISLESKKIVNVEEVKVKDNLHELKVDFNKWQRKTMEILDLAMVKARINKVQQDLQGEES